MLNLPGINDAQYYANSTVSTESLNRADAQMRNLLRVGGQLFDMVMNANQINEAMSSGRVTRASVEALYGNILDANGRVARVSMEGVSDMASDAWEALKNWIKELIRKVEDFFLKYSVFLKKTKQKLKDLRSHVRTKLSGGRNARMVVDAEGEGVRDKWDGERILNPGAFVAIFNSRAFGVTIDMNTIINAIRNGGLTDAQRDTIGNDIVNNAGHMAARGDARLSRLVTGEMDRSELNLKLDEHIEENLDRALDEEDQHTGMALLDMTDGHDAAGSATVITRMCEAYYKIADLIIKAKEQAVKDYDRVYKSVSKIKAGLNNQALRSLRQTLHQTLLTLFKISSAFRKNAAKLIKFVMTVVTHNEERNTR